MTMLTQEDITTIKDAIVSAVQPKYIYLFGSYAAGNEREDSDLDFLVVMPKGNVEKSRVANDIERRIGFTKPIAKDFVVESDEKFNRFKHIPYSFIGHIVQTGKLLYES